MEMTFKKEVRIIDEYTMIGFTFNEKFMESKMGFINFDIDDTKIKIDQVLNKVFEEKIIENRTLPLYTTLEIFFFDEIENLDSITFETLDMKITAKREELF